MGRKAAFRIYCLCPLGGYISVFPPCLENPIFQNVQEKREDERRKANPVSAGA